MELRRGIFRDYKKMSENPWSFWDILVSRRSHRKYADIPLESQFFREIQDFIQLSCAARKNPRGSVVLIEESETVEALSKSIYKGLTNRINAWLNSNKPGGFLVMLMDEEDVKTDRPEKLALTAMACEDTVLFFTENGLGSCWLGGVNMREIRRILGLNSDKYVPAVICFGRPAQKNGLSYDRVASMTLTKRRKPYSKIAHMEYYGNRHFVRTVDYPIFRVSDIQDARGLVEKIALEKWNVTEPPIGLTVEASIEAARLAPSAGNMQPWHFIVVRDKKRLETLRSLCQMVGDWRALVVAAGETRSVETKIFEKPFWMIDVPIALSHFTLLLASMDCPFRLAVESIDEEAINNFIGLPKGIRTVGVVGIR